MVLYMQVVITINQTLGPTHCVSIVANKLYCCINELCQVFVVFLLCLSVRQLVDNLLCQSLFVSNVKHLNCTSKSMMKIQYIIQYLSEFCFCLVNMEIVRGNL